MKKYSRKWGVLFRHKYHVGIFHEKIKSFSSQKPWEKPFKIRYLAKYLYKISTLFRLIFRFKISDLMKTDDKTPEIFRVAKLIYIFRVFGKSGNNTLVQWFIFFVKIL